MATAVTKPLAIDLFCGLFGWSDGLIQEGYRVIGFDLEDMHASIGIPRRSEFQLVVQDVLSLHGSQFKDAALIVASPPCQRYSWMAMPWSKAKAKAAEIRADESGEMLADLNALFNACFRIQAEASIAAGRRIPMVVENVRGAVPWVGRERWSFGSFCLWGDVPALMPIRMGREVMKEGIAHRSDGATNFHGYKSQGMNWSDKTKRGQDFTRIAGTQAREGVKNLEPNGYERNHPNAFGWKVPRTSSRSPKRKAASAMIAKIPLVLSRHIGYSFNPPWVR